MNITTVILVATAIASTPKDSLLSLKGKIVEAHTGEGIVFGTAELYQNNLLTQISYSDKDAIFEFKNLEAGIYTLEVAVEGMKEKTITKVKVISAQTPPLIVKMESKKANKEFLSQAVDLGAEGLGLLIRKLLRSKN